MNVAQEVDLFPIMELPEELKQEFKTEREEYEDEKQIRYAKSDQIDYHPVE
jgi:hypothetical protein